MRERATAPTACRLRRSHRDRATSPSGPPSPTAPVDAAEFGGAAGKIPVAAEGAQARLFGACHGDVGCDPVLAVADHRRSLLFLAGYRPTHAVDHVRDAEDALVALYLIDDRNLAHAEEIADQDREQMSRTAGATGEDLGQRIDHGKGRALIDEQRRGPV